MLHLPGHGRGGRLGPSPRAESRISGRPADLHSVGMTTPRHPGHRGEVAGPIPQRRGWATSRVRLPSTMAPMPQPGDPYASAFIAEVNKCWRMVHGHGGQAAHLRPLLDLLGCLPPAQLLDRHQSLEVVGARPHPPVGAVISRRVPAPREGRWLGAVNQVPIAGAMQWRWISRPVASSKPGRTRDSRLSGVNSRGVSKRIRAWAWTTNS
jgi:hypothetical protein